MLRREFFNFLPAAFVPFLPKQAQQPLVGRPVKMELVHLGRRRFEGWHVEDFKFGNGYLPTSSNDVVLPRFTVGMCGSSIDETKELILAKIDVLCRYMDLYYDYEEIVWGKHIKFKELLFDSQFDVMLDIPHYLRTKESIFIGWTDVSICIGFEFEGKVKVDALKDFPLSLMSHPIVELS